MTHDSLILNIEEHPFAQYVRILGKGKKGSRSFTEEEAFTAMQMILRGEVEDLQLGAFLMLVRVKEETPEELSGFVKAVQAQSNAPESLNVDLDWSSYAGKRRHLPWFIFAIRLIAQAGYRVFIHGAGGHTSERLYTEQVMRALELPVCESWAQCAEQLDQHNFSYAPLSMISPRLAQMIDMRSVMGLRSPVHSLARLINPLKAPNVLQGIFHPPYRSLHQESAKLLGYENISVIKGEGGEIERNPDNVMYDHRVENGELTEQEWPKLFPRRHVKAQEMTVEHMRKVWSGELEDEYGQAAIIATAALGLHLIKQGELSQDEAMVQAQELWDERKRQN